MTQSMLVTEGAVMGEPIATVARSEIFRKLLLLGLTIPSFRRRLA